MTTTFIPVQFKPLQGKKVEILPSEIEELSFADIPLKDGTNAIIVTESVLEEFIRRNVQIFAPEGQENLLIVGQQVTNKEGGRCDLVAIDGSGAIVLIEVKRDAEDMAARKEAPEFQAIRYAANYALIETPEELVQKLFAPYINKYRDEFSKKELSASQLAQELLADFLDKNKVNDFNQKQTIVLVASSYDEQTLSACAWLAKFGIELRCLVVSPMRYGDNYFLAIEQIIPPPRLDDYFVEIAEPSVGKKKTSQSKFSTGRQNLPRMPKLFEWGIVKAGDAVYVPVAPEKKAEVLDPQNVRFEDKVMTFNEWGRTVTGWSAINVYEWTYLAMTDKSLDDLRRAKLDELANQKGT